MNKKQKKEAELILSRDYDHLQRFMSYYKQIDLIRQRKDIKSILEIGVGNKTVLNYLREHNYKVHSVDNNPLLKPTVVGDIRDIPRKDNSYDCVLAFEVIEHIPYSYVSKILKELYRVSKKYVIISVPYSCIYFVPNVFCNVFKFDKDRNANISLTLARDFQDFKFDGFHYWELGRKNYNVENFERKVEKDFVIIQKEFNDFNPYHLFYVLQKL